MVKIVEVDEQPGVDSDEECYEIDPAEFTRKVNLKGTDDVILVAAKGEIEPEMVEFEDSVKASSGYGCLGTCSRFRESDGVTHGSRHDFGAGDSMDNPYEVEEDEPVLLQMEIVGDRFALDKSPHEFGADANNWDECRTAVTPYKIVVKAEPEYQINSEPGADDGKDGRFFHGEKGAVDVVSELGAKPSGPIDNNGVEVIPECVVLKCEPVDGDSVKCAEEDTYDHCLDTIPDQKTFGDEDDFVLV